MKLQLQVMRRPKAFLAVFLFAFVSILGAPSAHSRQLYCQQVFFKKPNFYAALKAPTPHELELAMDPARGYIATEGFASSRIEKLLGRKIQRHKDESADFYDEVLGPLSLKGPLPLKGSFIGLAKAAIKDVRYNTASHALFIDTYGLPRAKIFLLKQMVREGTRGSSKRVFYLE